MVPVDFFSTATHRDATIGALGMCLAIPALVISVSNENAKVSLNGVMVDVSLALVDDVIIGDYVLVHVGYALNKISPQEAELTLKMFAEAGMLTSDPEPNS